MNFRKLRQRPVAATEGMDSNDPRYATYGAGGPGQKSCGELDVDAAEAASKRIIVNDSVSVVSRARELLKIRRARSAIFPSGLFGEAAWDILLDTYVNEADRRPVSVKAASIASGVPATTALRWIAVLEQKKLLIRHGDPSDGRRTMLSLTPLARSSIKAVLTG